MLHTCPSTACRQLGPGTGTPLLPLVKYPATDPDTSLSGTLTYKQMYKVFLLTLYLAWKHVKDKQSSVLHVSANGTVYHVLF